MFDTAETYCFEPNRIARRAMLAGVAPTDIAKVRGFGRSEDILGRSLGDNRESAFVATKYYPTLLHGPAPEQRAVASANRIGIHCIDLYQVHQPPRISPLDKIMRGIRALQQVGVVREVGLSNGSLTRWRAAEQALGSWVLSNQVGYSLVNRSAERDLLPSRSPTVVSSSLTVRSNWDCCPASTTSPTNRRTAFGPVTRCSCRRIWNASAT